MLSVFLIAVSLALDAFAVSVSSGIAVPGFGWPQAVKMGCWFGGFQCLMPLLGWALGRQFEGYITSIDHWIAFLLLGWIGGKMVWDAFHDEGDCCPAGFDLRDVLMLAVATSIDALAVGVTFAFLKVAILPAVGLIGCTTFAISLAGVWIGSRFGSRFKGWATLAGGVILCLIGLKILLEHLGFLG